MGLPDHQGEMKHVGEVKMTTPQRKSSSISVDRWDNGSVDIVMTRSTQGEVLIRLPEYAAKEFAALMSKAVGVQK